MCARVRDIYLEMKDPLLYVDRRLVASCCHGQVYFVALVFIAVPNAIYIIYRATLMPVGRACCALSEAGSSWERDSGRRPASAD